MPLRAVTGWDRDRWMGPLHPCPEGWAGECADETWSMTRRLGVAGDRAGVGVRAAVGDQHQPRPEKQTFRCRG